MSAIRDCLWKRKIETEKEKHKEKELIVFYGCGHHLVKGRLSLNEDERHSILLMIEDGLIPRPEEAKCASCLMDALKTSPSI